MLLELTGLGWLVCLCFQLLFMGSFAFWGCSFVDSAVMISFFSAIMDALVVFLESGPIFYLYVLILSLFVVKIAKALIHN